MSLQRITACGVLAALLFPLLLAMFVVVSILAYLYTLPGGQLVASGLSHFIGREVPPVLLPPGSPVLVPPGPAALDPYREMIGAAAGRFGVEPRLIMAVILVESGGDPWATSPAGAAGLMQVMPSTFIGMGYDPRLLYDPAANIEAGTRYLAQCLDAFRGEVYWAAAAYNAGIPTARWLKATFGTVPGWFAFGETLRYVTAIGETLKRL